MPYVQQHFGFGNYLCTDPIGSILTRLLLYNRTEIFRCQASLIGIKTYIVVFAEMLGQVGMKLHTYALVGTGFVQFVFPVMTEQP